MCTVMAGLLVNITGVLAALAAETTPHTLMPVPIRQIAIEDEFWSPKRKVWQEVTIPDCFAKFENTGAIKNFDWVARRKERRPRRPAVV